MDSPVASGEFSIWVVSPANGWYVGKVVPATGSLTYTDSVTLNVPADTGYRVYVFYRATIGDPWRIYGYSPGTFAVTGLGTITVTAPSGAGSYAAGDSLPVSWNTDAPLASGEFSLWVVSPANGWYVGKIVAASGDLTYTDSVTLNVPPDTATASSSTTAPRRRPLGRLRLQLRELRGERLADPITVTAPSGTASYTSGDALAVSWTSTPPVASGEFSIWVVSPANGWYVGKVVAATGASPTPTASP